ncbi:MAG: dephospho-CoA kinase [Nitrospirota bacterium]|nr:dephospho-CoA kinase [Nitrospirota bacterium]
MGEDSPRVKYPKGFGRVKRVSKFFHIYCCSPPPMVWLAMIVVGLTGGLASGKTTVANMFQSLGARIIDADELARVVVKPGKPAWRDIVKIFGPQVLAEDQTINRQTLADIVFKSPKKLHVLQTIIHPRVAREQAKQVKIIQQNDPHAVIIYDAALLLEAHAHTRMDYVIVVTADRATQLARACRRDGLTKAQALRRIRQQMPLRYKLDYADVVLDGTWPRTQLRHAVQSLYRTYANEARSRTSGRSLKTP